MSVLVAVAVIIGGAVALLELLRRLVKALFSIASESIEMRKAVKASSVVIGDLADKVHSLDSRVNELEWAIRRALRP